MPEKEKKKPVILIADDLTQNLQILGNILKKQGYDITAAVNGKQAYELACKVKPDLILLDIMMPEMDGYETCVKLKSLNSTKNIPVIFITAKTETKDIIAGFKTGAVDYITKPFRGEELLARVRTHLELKQARDTQKELIKELRAALSKVKELSGLLPICAHCKKIRNDKGYWQQLESYIMTYTDAEFSHGLCPDCVDKYYSEFMDDDE